MKRFSHHVLLWNEYKTQWLHCDSICFCIDLKFVFFSIHPSALALDCYKCQPDTETGLCTQYTDSCESQCSSMTTTAYAGKSNKKSITGEFHDDSPL